MSVFQLVRFVYLCTKTKNQLQAIRLWNWVDHQNEPEAFWLVMGIILPWAFYDPADANSLRSE